MLFLFLNVLIYSENLIKNIIFMPERLPFYHLFCQKAFSLFLVRRLNDSVVLS